MKTTILLIAFGVVSTTTFAQQPTVKAAESASSSSAITAGKGKGKSSVTGTAAATVSADAAGTTVKKTTEVVQKTKEAAEIKINEASNEATDRLNNTNAAVSVETASSFNSSISTGDRNNNALSVNNNNDVMLQKEIKGADVVNAAQNLENTTVGALQTTTNKIEAGSAKTQSAIKSNAHAVSGKVVSATAIAKTVIKARPIKAVVHTKTITGLKIR